MEEYFDEWIPSMAVYYRWCFADSVSHAKPRLAQSMVASDASYDTVEQAGNMIEAWSVFSKLRSAPH